jgi:hypothetical protein
MKRFFTLSLTWVLLVAPTGAMTAAGKGQELKATASAHGITYVWNASASTYTGLGYNLYVGTAPGGESATPVNAALIGVGCSAATCTYTYSNVVPLATYYATLAACVPNGGGSTCSVKTQEVAATIPLAQSDIGTPTGFNGSSF